MVVQSDYVPRRLVLLRPFDTIQDAVRGQMTFALHKCTMMIGIVTIVLHTVHNETAHSAQ